jgi:DNA-directed RNA polymerase subunit RPC12/RpoP
MVAKTAHAEGGFCAFPHECNKLVAEVEYDNPIRLKLTDVIERDEHEDHTFSTPFVELRFRVLSASIDLIYHKYHTGSMARVKLSGYRCERCDHEWVPREKDQEPRVCPKCKSPYWDRPRQSESNGKRNGSGRSLKAHAVRT